MTAPKPNNTIEPALKPDVWGCSYKKKITAIWACKGMNNVTEHYARMTRQGIDPHSETESTQMNASQWEQKKIF